ncbi:MAG: TonB-dependent receptor [Terracidiphilus sp.]
MTHSFASTRKRVLCVALSFLVLFTGAAMRAQESNAKIEGSVVDAQGRAVVPATVTVKNEKDGVTRTTYTDANGFYSVGGLAGGAYTVEAVSPGFAPISKTGLVVTAGQTQQVGLKLGINTVAEEVIVNAGIDSIASQSALSGGFIEERSAQSLISNSYIRNFISPVADFGEIVQIVPGTFTTSSDGVGLGQSKTYFRGFPDGDYDIDFDGVPFYDTNTPTHHSWAFFPAQWIGGVDFDRSPGSASTIGPTPFGGSIHLLSMPLTSEQDLRGTLIYSTWNTKLYEGSYNSGSFGLFGSPKKSNLFVDVHHMTSDGYQTFNFNTRNAGSLLYQYQFSPKTVLTGFSGVIQLTANTYGLNPTRCQTLGAPAGNSTLCAATTKDATGATVNTSTTGLVPDVGYGYKFMMVNNSDPVNWLDYQYNHYQVPTDFEYVGLKTEFGKGWYLEVKPYTYNYDNAELFTNQAPITDLATSQLVVQGTAAPLTTPIQGGVWVETTAGTSGAANTYSLYFNGVLAQACNVQVKGKLPCAIDKYNSYRKYGTTAVLSQTSNFGVFRGGIWYDWARTSRHQYPSDPLNHWADQPLGNFDETFYTDSYQPYAEYEFHLTPKFNVTAGTKFAYYTYDVIHKADDGKTVGNLCPLGQTTGCPATATDTGTFFSTLPSLDLNYRFQPNWAGYIQVATGSIIPPSSVYDYNHTPSASVPTPGLLTPPKQQKSTTYQVGTVLKLNRITLDGDAYRVRFQNSYNSVIDPTTSETVNYLQPSSITQGLEFETTAVLTKGLNLYLNATAANAYYEGELNANTTSTQLTAPVYEKAPSGLWVQQTPADTEMQGLTYTSRGLDLGIFNKRVGEQRVDAGAYHNQAIIAAFSTLDSYVNYTVRNRSIFDQTKIQLGGNNLLNQHNITALTLSGSPNMIFLNGGGACTSTTATATNPCDAFITNGPTPISANDNPTFISSRSFSVSITFGFAPGERK